MWRSESSTALFYSYDRSAKRIPDGTTDLLDLLGPTVEESRATHTFLLDFMDAVGPRYDSAGRQISAVFCGVSGAVDAAGTGTACVHLTPEGAYIALSPTYLRLLERVAVVAAAMPNILAFIRDVQFEYGSRRALDVVSNIRGSLFHYFEMDGREVDPSLEAMDLWKNFAGAGPREIAQSAVLFTVAHEIAHLRYSGRGKRRDMQLFATHTELARSALPHQIWPENRSHREEIIADRAAIDIGLESGHPAGSLARLALGSIVAGVALAVDGWNVDHSAVSESHPSPFLRLSAMPMFWCSVLDDRRRSRHSHEVEPAVDAAGLEQLAQTHALEGLLAGRFREGRDELRIFDEVTDRWGCFLSAAGFHGLFMHT